jgi:hypothetical protein
LILDFKCDTILKNLFEVAMRICGICDKELKNDDKIVACNKCNGLYHLECFEELGGCANPSCENYVPPSLSLAELSQSDDVLDDDYEVFYDNPDDDTSLKEEEKWEFDEDYRNDYTVTSTENEEDYEISEDDENDDFSDTPLKKSIFQCVIEWLIFIGLSAFAIFLIIEILK